MKTKQIVCVSIITMCFFIPAFVHAQLRISEIMYDPEGSDTKREWIEVFNAGSGTIDLTTYFVLENDVYHKITSEVSALLEAGGYAVIASSITDLIQEYSSYKGLVVDSVFSLNNTGETIALADSSKVTTDTFAYTLEMGANNNGQSLQINDGTILMAGSTFGTANKTESETIAEDDPSTPDSSSGSSGSSSLGNSSHSGQTNVSTFTPSADFKVTAGRSRIVSIHTPITFEALVSKSDIRAKSRWNFGDFETDTGRVVDHIYRYPGKYQLVLETKSKDYTAIARTEVIVVEPQISITDKGDSIVFTNSDSKELNIGGFRIVFADKEFVVPQDTIIAPKNSIAFSNPERLIVKRFEYPDGTIYQDFEVLPILEDTALIQAPLILVQ